MRTGRKAIVVALTVITALEAFATPSRSSETQAFSPPSKRDGRIYTMLVASCPSTSVAQELGKQLFASLVWKDPAKLILDRDLKTVRNEIVAAKCTVAAPPKQIDPWTGPATDRYEISAVAKPSLHLAVIDCPF